MRNAKTVADLALAVPSSIPVFERLLIDYCCQGREELSRACREAGVTVQELMEMIEEQQALCPIRDWKDEPLTELIRFIVATHHHLTRTSLEALQPLATNVRELHGERHPELEEVEQLVDELASDLVPHMLREERVLFPHVAAMVKAIRTDSDPPPSFFGSVSNPIRTMALEHESAGETMAAIRRVTMEYEIPDDACPSYKAFYILLEDLERDLHRHLHLENRIVFPRAAELESRAQEAVCSGAFFGRDPR